MTDSTAELIKGSDNAVTLTLLDDGDPIAITWTELDIYIGRPPIVSIHRTSNADGIAFIDGELAITPADLDESLDELVDGVTYPIWIIVKDASNADGIDFGGEDSDDQVVLFVQSRP